MKSLIIASFVSPQLPYSSSSTGCYHAPLRALKQNKVIRSQSSYAIHNIGRFNRTFLLPRKHNTSIVASAVSEQPVGPGDTSPQSSLPNALNAFYRFSRPHTVIGTALSIVSVSLLAVQKLSDFSPVFFIGVMEAIVASFFMNIYIVGLNQLSDIEIDKVCILFRLKYVWNINSFYILFFCNPQVNKPYLPLASGEYSVKTGVLIVSSFALMSFWLGWIVGSWPLFWALFVSFVLGTAYSINVSLTFVVKLIILQIQNFHCSASEFQGLSFIFIPIFRRYPLCSKLTSFVLYVFISYKFCPLGLTRLVFSVKFGHMLCT
ncbi:putative homogentisate phytyltransferase [Helianthus annuus]|nr:putative homogentisate phytyltransferase [Helianthus annuus]